MRLSIVCSLYIILNKTLCFWDNALVARWLLLISISYKIILGLSNKDNNYKPFALAKYFSLRSFLANKLTKFSSFFYFFFLSLSHTISCSIWEIFAFPWGMYRRLENLLLVFLSAKTSKKWTSLEPQVRKRKYFLKWMRSKWNWGNIGHFRLIFLNYTSC